MRHISFLRVLSALMAVGGLVLLMDAIYGEMLGGLDEFFLGHMGLGITILAIAIIQILANALQLTIGAFAFTNEGNRDMVRFFIASGILIFLLQLVAFGMQTYMMMEDVVCFGFGLVVPVFFTIGAIRHLMKIRQPRAKSALLI